MRGYVAFVKKEWMEGIRTYKLYIILAVFLLIAIMSPLTALLTPELFKSFAEEGMKIELPDPSAIDSWTQFYKNITGMGLIVVGILFSGLMANEYSKKTMIPVLSKGLRRRDMILAKFTMASIHWSAAYVVCFVVNYLYTEYYWDQSGLHHIIIAAVFLWLIGELLITLLLFGGTILKKQYGSLLFAVVCIGLLFLLEIIPAAADYNPIRLMNDNVKLLNGKIELCDFGIPTVITIVLTAAFLVGSIAIFDHKDIN